MTDDTDLTDANRPGEAEHDADGSASGPTHAADGVFDATRRDFLKAAGAGAGALALGTAVTGSAAAEPQIPTPRLHIEGNLVKDPEGNTVKLRGINMADPKRLDVTAPARGKNAEQVVDLLTSQEEGWYPRIVRVPAQPVDIGEHTPGAIDGSPEPPAYTQAQLEEYLETYYDPIIERLGERGVYAIVDYHRHWKPLKWAEGQQGPINHDLQEETITFWETVAPRYADEDHVLYELYNEPTEPGIWADPTDRDWAANLWEIFWEFGQPIVDTIREHADNIVIIGSPSWTQTPEGYYVKPFEGENLAYAYHIYAGHPVSMNHEWAEAATNGEGTDGVYEDVPLFVTEFGWEQNHNSATQLQGTTSDFADAMFDWLESSDGIHYTAWCADPVWRPVMFSRPFIGEDPDFPEDVDSIGSPYEEEVPVECPDLPCEWELLGGEKYAGEYVKAKLEELKDRDLPSSEGSVEPDDPPAPEGLEATGVTESTIELAWDTVSAADEYRVYLEGSLETETASTGVTISGLEAGSSYEIGVATVAAGDESDVTSTTVTTLPDDDEGGLENSQDTTGDGLHDDINGDGTTTTSDVTAFFDTVQEPTVADNPQYYDFDGNGEVTISDVLELFESL